MAEAAGFVLGALSLASLFSTCVDAFDQIRAARSFGRDYQILITRYDIRKTRLLQWGEGVGLLDEVRSGRDPRLDQAGLQSSLENALNCIRMLLTETEKLRTKYGLEEIACDPADTKELTPAIAISQRRVSTFRASYTRFLGRIKDKQKAAPLFRKTQWAICGGDEFRSLINDLDGLIEDLHKLVPVSRRFRKLMVKEDFEALPEDITALKLIEEACIIDQVLDTSSDGQDSWLEIASQRVQATEMATQDRRGIDEWLADISTDEVNMQADAFPDPPPPPTKQQDALAALQRGGELGRRASRRVWSYQIQKHLQTSPNRVPIILPAQNTPIPNQGQLIREIGVEADAVLISDATLPQSRLEAMHKNSHFPVMEIEDHDDHELEENETRPAMRGSGVKKSFRRHLARDDPASYARAKTLYPQHHLGRGAAMRVTPHSSTHQSEHVLRSGQDTLKRSRDVVGDQPSHEVDVDAVRVEGTALPHRHLDVRYQVVQPVDSDSFETVKHKIGDVVSELDTGIPHFDVANVKPARHESAKQSYEQHQLGKNTATNVTIGAPSSTDFGDGMELDIFEDLAPPPVQEASSQRFPSFKAPQDP